LINSAIGGIVKKLWLGVLTLGVVSLYAWCQAETMDMSKDEKPMTGMAETAKGKTVTLTGTLVDLACYLDDHDAGNDHMGMKACGTECLKGGSPAGLLVGKKLYILVFPAPAFADFVGKQVELTGELFDSTNLIPAKAATIDKSGKKTNISLKGKAMM
jgi:hypothetical protein